MAAAYKQMSRSISKRPERWLAILVLGLAIALLPSTSVSALNTCYAIANTGNHFVSLDKSTGKTVEIGPTGGVDIEAMTFQFGTDTLYAADASELGTVDLVTGRYTRIGSFGAGSGNEGLVNFSDVDSLAWDNVSDTLYGVARHEGGVRPDLLFQIDPTTGSFKPGMFNGADYVPVGITKANEADIDDIAFNPLTGILYGVANSGGTGGTLVVINKQTGAITEIGPLLDVDPPNLPVDDMEGLSFFNDGQLYGSTGDGGLPNNANHLFSVDLTSARATRIGAFPRQHGDYEALACLTATIADDDEDTIVNAGEDVNQDGNLANDDTDGDHLPNYADADDDGDGLTTVNEDPNGNGNPQDDDSDRDGIPNYLENDDDGDGVLTRDEDANHDGDLRNDDADGDHVPDYLEGGNTDNDDKPNQLDTDDDGDGVLTEREDPNHDGNSLNDDSDGDSLPNFLDDDDDGDGLPPHLEDADGDNNANNDDADGDHVPNYLDPDADNDGRLDSAEWSLGSGDLLQGCTVSQPVCTNNNVDDDTSPNFLDTDSDNDGAPDGAELNDTNQDGIPDWLDPWLIAGQAAQRLYLPVALRYDQ